MSGDFGQDGGLDFARGNKKVTVFDSKQKPG
jgi:hypothetical protein